jgi:signal transduction histidine kinase
MTAAPPSTLQVDLAQWPGVVLQLTPNGDVVASNGRLETRLGGAVAGRNVTALLDADSSHAKWARIAADADATTKTWELIFAGDDRVLDPCAFSVIREPGVNCLWLVEHPPTARLREMAAEVEAVNAELAGAQRRVEIEQARLARALAEVERSNLALDEFAHVVSHDLKAPVRAIREYSGFLLEPPAGTTDDERKEDLRRIHELSVRMRRMIDDALAYARAGHAGDRVETVDVAALVHDVVDFLAPPPDVTIQLPSAMPSIVTERTPLEQVFRNLISNALTYRRAEGARIALSAREDGAMCEITVADNGPGIAADDQARIWRLFHTSRPGEGSGLGLAMVKRIVEGHQGTVAVRSAPGEGSAFIVRWPRTPLLQPAPRSAA